MGNWFSVPSELPSGLDKSSTEFIAFRIELLEKHLEVIREASDTVSSMVQELARLLEVQLSIIKKKSPVET